MVGALRWELRHRLQLWELRRWITHHCPCEVKGASSTSSSWSCGHKWKQPEARVFMQPQSLASQKPGLVKLFSLTVPSQ